MCILKRRFCATLKGGFRYVQINKQRIERWEVETKINLNTILTLACACMSSSYAIVEHNKIIHYSSKKYISFTILWLCEWRMFCFFFILHRPSLTLWCRSNEKRSFFPLAWLYFFFSFFKISSSYFVTFEVKKSTLKPTLTSLENYCDDINRELFLKDGQQQSEMKTTVLI